MEIIAHLLGNTVNFLLLLLSYVGFFYLLFLVGIFTYCHQTQRRFRLTPELWALAAGALVYLLTCVTWKVLGF